MLILTYILAWAVAVGAGWVIGGAAGRRYDALWLTGILGFLGLAVFGVVLAIDSRRVTR